MSIILCHFSKFLLLLHIIILPLRGNLVTQFFGRVITGLKLIGMVTGMAKDRRQKSKVFSVVGEKIIGFRKTSTIDIH